jgi:phosphatidylglycerophosphate synthase
LNTPLPKPQRRKFRQETVIHSYIVRPLAQELVLWIWNTNITPNQLTFSRLILGIIYLYLFTLGTASGFIIGIVLFQVAEIIDHADGMLARLKNQTSKLGQCYEYIIDELFAIESGLLGLAIAYGAYQYGANILFIYLAVAVLYVHYFHWYIKLKINLTEKDTNNKMSMDHDGETLLRIIGVPFKQSLFNALRTINCWRNQLYFVGIIGLLCGAELTLIATFIVFLLLNLLRTAIQLKEGYTRHKE